MTKIKNLQSNKIQRYLTFEGTTIRLLVISQHELQWKSEDSGMVSSNLTKEKKLPTQNSIPSKIIFSN